MDARYRELRNGLNGIYITLIVVCCNMYGIYPIPLHLFDFIHVIYPVHLAFGICSVRLRRLFLFSPLRDAFICLFVFLSHFLYLTWLLSTHNSTSHGTCNA